ncbi:hypothetical protein IL306_009719 [Fusarium sp. DS 682]|nr:hypothetical protein IL306_009719 [Fusarium sp. DS 682]
MPVEIPSRDPEINYLRERVKLLEEENGHINHMYDELENENGRLVSEIEDLKEKLDQEVNQRKQAENTLAKATACWRAAEEELTEKMGENDRLKKQAKGESFIEPP